MAKRERKIIEKGLGYEIYLKDRIYFLDIGGQFNVGFDTFEGACESAYYQGKRKTK